MKEACSQFIEEFHLLCCNEKSTLDISVCMWSVKIQIQSERLDCVKIGTDLIMHYFFMYFT